MLFVYLIHLSKERKEEGIVTSHIFTAQIILFCSEQSKLQIICNQIDFYELVRPETKKMDILQIRSACKIPSQNDSLLFLLQKALM